MKIKFSKMHGLGNDFVVIDGMRQYVELTPETIRALGDRHMGVGFDQLLLVEPPETPGADFRYRIFNADGSGWNSAAMVRAASCALCTIKGSPINQRLWWKPSAALFIRA